MFSSDLLGLDWSRTVS